MSAPVRIQRRRSTGWRMPEGAVYVGRPTIFECHSCGHEFTADDAGCASCTLCPSCTPAACICAEGRQLRREDAAEADWRRFRETTGVGAVGW